MQPIKARVSIFRPGERSPGSRRSDRIAAAGDLIPGADHGTPERLESQNMGMPLWLILIVVGIVLALVGFGGAGNLLIWLGVIILVVGVVLTLLNRSGTRV